jgi:hypothetical protein
MGSKKKGADAPPDSQTSPVADTQPPARTFKLGWKKNEADERDLHARAHFGAPRNLPGEALRLADLVRRVRDQASTSSCVGHAIASAVDVRLRFLQKTLPEPAPLGVYGFARMLEKSSRGTLLADEGCYPRDALKGLKQFGIPAESDWPFTEDPAVVNEELPWDVEQKASAGRVEAFYALVGGGETLLQDICNALNQNYPVPYGTNVTQAFMDYAGGGPSRAMKAPGPLDRRLGGHETLILGYTTVAGRLVFQCLNSWGTSWGDTGFYWADQDFLLDPEASDFNAIQVAAA